MRRSIIGRWTFPAKVLTGAIGAVVVTIAGLALSGRVWWCACGQVYPFSLDIWSAHNSQHLADPYVFTHLLHGFLFCALARLLVRDRLEPEQVWLLVVLVECLWELAENTPLVIVRYRESTMALDYFGDSIANSLGDILACGLGCWLGLRLPVWASVGIFVATEVMLALWIRDGLLLGVWMLLFSTESLRNWQLHGRDMPQGATWLRW